MSWLLNAGRLQRRIVTIPAVFTATLVLWICSPLILPVTALVDLVTGPRRLRLTRLVLFALNYSLLECAAIIAAIAIWPCSASGLSPHRLGFRVNAALERWWVTSLMRATQRWIYVDIRVDNLPLLGQGPMVIASHHASFFDAILPAVLLVWAESDATPRYTLKRELLLSPAFDIVGNRLPNHFVDRAPAVRETELDGFRALARDLGNDALVVFPEGTFRTPERAERAVASVARTNPERAKRLALLQHMLPLRPGGLGALLDAAPHADLVLVTHHGLERFGSRHAILANTPLRGQVTVNLERIPADDIPRDDAERAAFLDEHWLGMDRWITAAANRGDESDDDPTR